MTPLLAQTLTQSLEENKWMLLLAAVLHAVSIAPSILMLDEPLPRKSRLASHVTPAGALTP